MDHEIFRKIHTIISKMTKHWGGTIIVAQIVAIIVFPFIEIILALPEKTTPWQIWLIVGISHFIVGSFSIIGSIKLNDFIVLSDIDGLEQNVSKLENHLKQEEEKNRLLYDELDEHFHRQVALQTSILILKDLVRKKEVPPNSEDVEKILAPLIRGRSKVLGYKGEDYFNFCVYLINKDASKLELFFRECDDRIQRSDRKWDIGVGHVGIAFARSETIIKSDARNDSEYKGRHSLETDDKYYVSFISSPIFKGSNSRNDEIGVFVITSNRPNHYEDDDKIIVEAYSYLLSLFFSICCGGENAT